MVKHFKVRLRPNNKQATRLSQYAECARFAYNWAILKEEENHKQGKKFMTDRELRKEFTSVKKTQNYGWLNEISGDVSKQAIKDAFYAYKRFFNGVSKHPRLKKKGAITKSFYQDSVKVQFSESHVRIEKISLSLRRNRQKLNWVRMCERGRIPTDAKCSNIRFVFDGLYWYVCVTVNVDDADCSTPSSDGVGVDLGIKDFAICSDGTVYKNINKSSKIKKLEKKKSRLQRSLSRKFENSKHGETPYKGKNISKNKIRLLKAIRKTLNIREDHLNKAISEIIKRSPKFICIEDLNLRGMMKNKRLAKRIQEEKLYEFRIKIQKKAKDKNIKIIIADRFFPSSKLCSRCGKIKSDLKLYERVYRCECGNVIDRDYQASLNLKRYGENALEKSI